MFYNKIKTGQKVLNKVNGELCQITPTIDGFTAVPVDEESESTAVVLNEKNAIAFKLIEDVPSETPSGFSVRDGVLYNGENPIDMGEIKADKIYGYAQGIVVLQTSSKDRVAISGYLPERERFTILSDIRKDAIVTGFQGKDQVGLLILETEEVDTGDDTKEKRVLRSNILLVKEGTTKEYRVDAPVTAAGMSFIGPNVIFSAIGSIDDEGFMQPGPVKTVIVNTDRNTVKSAVKEGTDGVFSETNGSAMVLSSEQLVIDLPERFINITSSKCAELNGLDKVADVTLKDGSLRVTLTNKDLTEVKTLVKTRTEDRGAIYSVE